MTSDLEDVSQRQPNGEKKQKLKEDSGSRGTQWYMCRALEKETESKQPDSEKDGVIDLEHH